MKIYKHIQESKKVLKTLASEFVNMDNAKTRIIELNVLIRLVNSTEQMLVNKYKTEVLDVFILNHIYRTLLKEKGDLINISESLENIFQDLRFGRNYQKEQLIGYLQQKELEYNLTFEKIQRTSFDDWSDTIENTLTDVKKQIIWNETHK